MWEFHGVQFDSSKGIETKHNETKDLGSELGAPSSAQKSIFNLLQLVGNATGGNGTRGVGMGLV